jgi:hypothetical protein
MNKTTSFISRVAIISGFALGAFALAAVANWTAPISAPPACNAGDPGCDSPLHVGYGSQTKQGGLILNGLTSPGVAMTYGLWVVNAPIKAAGGLVIETRTSDPASPETGRMWLITP